MGTTEIRLCRGTFLNSFWVRDGHSPTNAMAHLEVTFYGDGKFNPSVRYGALSKQMVAGLQGQFDYIWGRSIPAGTPCGYRISRRFTGLRPPCDPTDSGSTRPPLAYSHEPLSQRFVRGLVPALVGAGWTPIWDDGALQQGDDISTFCKQVRYADFHAARRPPAAVG